MAATVPSPQPLRKLWPRSRHRASHRIHQIVMEGPARTPFKGLANPGDIRVLYLNVGGPDSPLSGWLEYASLGNQPRYEALSYEWGSPEKTRTITLQDGVVHPITEALHDALRDLRQDAEPGQPRILWADAICINQEDIGELQNQVSIMASIYRGAERVVTYIGPERDNSSLAVGFARDLCNHVETWGDGSLLGGNPDPALAHPALPPLSDRRWRAVKALTLRTWASRCWCAQEFLLNPRLLIMCGTTKLPDWYLISDLAQHVVNRSLTTSLLPTPEEDPHSLRECIRFLGDLRWSFLGGRSRFTIRQLLERSHPFRATDPRDKVYSVLGLAEDRGELDIAVDYTCTAERLYIHTATRILQTKPVVRLLYNCLHVKSLALPSWVPDWSTWQFGSRGLRLSAGYDACGSTADELSVDGVKLHVSGCLVDEVVYVGEPIGPHYVFLDSVIPGRQSWLLAERAEISRRLEPDTSSDAVDEMLWRTLIGNITMYERPAEQDYRALYDAHANYDGEGSAADTTAAAREFCDAVRRRSRYRWLAVTRRGHVGAVPETVEVGDWVSMFQGGRLLFVVRPRGSEFTYVGHAYVHGLMNGEVLRAGWYSKQTITLV